MKSDRPFYFLKSNFSRSNKTVGSLSLSSNYKSEISAENKVPFRDSNQSALAQSPGTRDEAQTFSSKFSRVLIQDKHGSFFISAANVLIYIKTDAFPLYTLWKKKKALQAVF